MKLHVIGIEGRTMCLSLTLFRYLMLLHLNKR